MLVSHNILNIYHGIFWASEFLLSPLSVAVTVSYLWLQHQDSKFVFSVFAPILHDYPITKLTELTLNLEVTTSTFSSCSVILLSPPKTADSRLVILSVIRLDLDPLPLWRMSRDKSESSSAKRLTIFLLRRNIVTKINVYEIYKISTHATHSSTFAYIETTYMTIDKINVKA